MSIKNGFLVFLNTRLYGGSTTLKPEDIGLDANSLPPAEIAQLGKKHLINPKDLTKVYSKAKAVRYLLEQKAIKVEGAFFVPEAIAQSILAEVDAAIEEARTEIQTFLGGFEAKAKAWRDAHPEWSNLFTNLPSTETLAQRMKIKRTAVRVGEIEGGEEDFANSLMTELLASINQVGAHLHKMSKSEILRGRSMLPVRSLQKKLAAYGFLSTELFQLSHDLGEILTGKNRDLEGDEKDAVGYAAAILARADVLDAVKQAVAEGRNALDMPANLSLDMKQEDAGQDEPPQEEHEAVEPAVMPEIQSMPKPVSAPKRAVGQAFF